MPLSPASVILYAADPDDYAAALSAASLAGVSSANVIGNFETAWNDVASGNYLVIAVGLPSDSALFYNPCGWANPAGEGAGSTPFNHTTAPRDTLPGKNEYESASGSAGWDSLKLAVMLAYYAVNGTYPSGYGTLPATATPSDSCPSVASADEPCPY